MRNMFNTDRNSDARNALGLPAILTSPFGLWPLDKNNIFLRIRWSVSTFSLIVQILLAVYETSLSCIAAENEIDNLLIIIFAIIALAKMIFYYKYRDNLRLNVESAIDDWSSEDAEDYSEILNSYKSKNKKVANCFTAVGLTAAVGFPVKIFVLNPDPIIKVLRDEDDYNGNVTMVLGKRFLYPAVCALNNVSQYSHWAIVSAQFVQLIICVTINMTCDIFFIAIVHHLCGQYQILKTKFSTFYQLQSETEARQKFCALIVRHGRLLKLANMVETSFNMVMLTQMIVNIVIINVAGFHLLVFLKKAEVLGVLTNVAMIQFALVETFLYSYVGDELSNHGADIELSVYESKWHRMPKNLAKDIIFVMRRANFSFHLTAGKLFKMTRSSYTDIVKTAFSYLSVLRILIDDRHT